MKPFNARVITPEVLVQFLASLGITCPECEEYRIIIEGDYFATCSNPDCNWSRDGDVIWLLPE